MRMILTLLMAGVMTLTLTLAGCGTQTESTSGVSQSDISSVQASSEADTESQKTESAVSVESSSTTESSEVSDASSSDTDSSAASSNTVSESSAAIKTSETESTPEKESSSGDAQYLDNSADGEHAITADGETASYVNYVVTKSGDSEGDEADFYGENSAIFATNGAELSLSDMDITTNGTHANAVFSYGEGTVVNISDSTIETSGNCSGGIMTTGGGTMNAENLTVHTTGNSSAPIRSDRGGGTVNVTGGSYTSEGKGSPVIYSTADITVTDSELTSTSAQGVVVEGKNSVTLNNVNLTANNVSKNSDKSDWYQAVMIYQSMSGDAASGTASFTMNGGTLTNMNGDIFFVNNTVAEIALANAEITNEGDGVFLRAAAAGWGSEGSNGGHVTMTADSQEINGDMRVDSVSSLNLYLTNGSAFTGAVNPDEEEGEVYIEIEDGSTWTLTGDSYITSLTCSEGAIDLNGYTLYVNGQEYEEGSASEGTAIEVDISQTGSGAGGAPEGGMPDMPGGTGGNGGTPPEKPDGASGGTPPAKPGS